MEYHGWRQGNTRKVKTIEIIVVRAKIPSSCNKIRKLSMFSCWQEYHCTNVGLLFVPNKCLYMISHLDHYTDHNYSFVFVWVCNTLLLDEDSGLSILVVNLSLTFDIWPNISSANYKTQLGVQESQALTFWHCLVINIKSYCHCMPKCICFYCPSLISKTRYVNHSRGQTLSPPPFLVHIDTTIVKSTFMSVF